jgi:hypothetical protein
VKLAEYEQWRIVLDEGGRASATTIERIRQLERELARKEKALAEAAALLILKKKRRPSIGRTRTAPDWARGNAVGRGLTSSAGATAERC